MADSELRFGFGENWQSFVDKALDETRVKQSVDGLKTMLHTDSLEGKHFLDIGCGSGLSSMAACILGAEKITAIDYDPNSVAAATALRDGAGIPPDKWTITQGSALDKDFLSSLPPADIVYSWGVLHHTGDMWSAIDNAADLVRPGGTFAISIYNRVEGRKGSSLWWKIKKAYVSSPAPLKKLMEFIYVSLLVLQMMAAARNPIRHIRMYGDEMGRGMSFMHDRRDWLGGFPYEYASAGEIFNYVHEKFGFRMIYLNSHDGNFCNEFSFLREG